MTRDILLASSSPWTMLLAKLNRNELSPYLAFCNKRLCLVISFAIAEEKERSRDEMGVC